MAAQTSESGGLVEAEHPVGELHEQRKAGSMPQPVDRRVAAAGMVQRILEAVEELTSGRRTACRFAVHRLLQDGREWRGEIWRHVVNGRRRLVQPPAQRLDPALG